MKPDDSSPTERAVTRTISKWSESVQIDFPTLFKQLGRTVMAAVDDEDDRWDARGSLAKTASKLIKSRSKPEDQGWMLSFWALARSVDRLVSEAAADGLFNKLSEAEIDAIAQEVTTAFEKLEVTLEPGFLENLGDRQLLKSFRPVFQDWLVKFGVHPGLARSISSRISGYYAQEFTNEWNANPKLYARAQSRFTYKLGAEISTEKRTWLTYVARVRQRVHASLYDEAFSISEIYVQARAAYETPPENDSDSDIFFFERDPVRHGVDLEKHILDWAREGKAENPILGLSGPPGYGKTVFCKMFAARYVQILADEDIFIIYIPLEDFSASGDLARSVQDYSHVTGDLGFNPFDSDFREGKRILLFLDGFDNLAWHQHADFIRLIQKGIEKYNSDDAIKLQILVTGTDSLMWSYPQVFAQETLLEILPLCPPSDFDAHNWPTKGDRLLLASDLRHDWWRNFSEATGESYMELPKQLDNTSLRYATAIPVYNYGIAMGITRFDIDVDDETTLNDIYEQLLLEQFKMQGVSAAADSGYDPLVALEDAALARWHGYDLPDFVDEDDGVEEEEEEEEGESRKKRRSLGRQTGSGRRPAFRSPDRDKKKKKKKDKKHKNGLFANLGHKKDKDREKEPEAQITKEPNPPKPVREEPKPEPEPAPKPKPEPPAAKPKPEPPAPKPKPQIQPIETTTEIVEQEEVVVRESRPPEPVEAPEAEYVPANTTLGGNALGFTEYLLARRLVRLMAEIVTQRVREIHNPDCGWNRTEALVAWIRATGPSRMSSTVFEFLTREVSRVLKNQKESKSAGITWQAVFSDLFVRVVIHGSPMEWLDYDNEGRGRITYGELRRRANHSEESLLAACHACAVFTKNIASIDWPQSSPGALGAWLNRIRGQMSDLDTARFGKIASQVSNTPIVMRSLQRLDMSKLLLVLQNFSGAQLAGARLNGANLSRAGFRKADLEGANLDTANLTEASLNYAFLRGASLNGARLHGAAGNFANFREASLIRARVGHGWFEGAVFADANLNWAELIRSSFIEADFTSAGMTGAKLIESNFTSANFEDVTLDDADLTHITARKTIFKNASLDESKLSNANLDEADLDEANLSRADLSNASLNNASLIGANLNYANLTNAQACHADFTRTNLDDAILKGADLTSAKLEEASINETKLEGANMTRVSLKGASLTNADLRDANLKEAKFTGASLDHMILSGAMMNGADLTWCSLDHADLSEAKLRKAILTKSSFTSAKLVKADLEEANMVKANFFQADLTGANLNSASLAEANLHGAILRDALMIGATVQDSNFFGANLRCADLSHANLAKANFFEADLTGANLDKARISRSQLTELQRIGIKGKPNWLDVPSPDDLVPPGQINYEEYKELSKQEDQLAAIEKLQEKKEAEARLKERERTETEVMIETEGAAEEDENDRKKTPLEELNESIVQAELAKKYKTFEVVSRAISMITSSEDEAKLTPDGIEELEAAAVEKLEQE